MPPYAPDSAETDSDNYEIQWSTSAIDFILDWSTVKKKGQRRSGSVLSHLW